MNNEQICRIVADVLGIDRATTRIDGSTRLLGSLPEFDSMAVVAILTAIEDEFGLAFDDDEIAAELFETVDTLTAFVAAKADSAA